MNLSIMTRMLLYIVLVRGSCDRGSLVIKSREIKCYSLSGIGKGFNFL